MGKERVESTKLDTFGKFTATSFWIITNLSLLGRMGGQYK